MSGVSKGRDAFAASRARVVPAPDAQLARTAIGRGQLRHRAAKGDQGARAALKQHGESLSDLHTAYDDLLGGARDAD